MIIYSVTVTLDQAVEADWREWMQNAHIPEVMATGYFVSSHFQKLLDPLPEPGVATYNIQYGCASMEMYEKYQATEAPALQADHSRRYKDRFVAFRTLLLREKSY